MNFGNQNIPSLLHIFNKVVGPLALFGLMLMGPSSSFALEDHPNYSTQNTACKNAAGRHDYETLMDISRVLAVCKDINAVNWWGQTPLHWAAMHGQVDIAFNLILKGANIHATDFHGETPLHWAARFGQIEIVNLLIGNGANIDFRNTSGETPLHVAAKNNNTESMRLLLANGADVNAKDRHKSTPLHFVKQVEGAAFLIENGADVNAKDNDGYTPLHYALYSAADGISPMTNLLINKGADVNAKNRWGETPFDVGRKNNQLPGFENSWKIAETNTFQFETQKQKVLKEIEKIKPKP